MTLPHDWGAAMRRYFPVFIGVILLSVFSLASTLTLVLYSYLAPPSYEQYLAALGIGLLVCLLLVNLNFLVSRGFAWGALGNAAVLGGCLLLTLPSLLFSDDYLHYAISLALQVAGLGLLSSRRYREMLHLLRQLRQLRKAR